MMVMTISTWRRNVGSPLWRSAHSGPAHQHRLPPPPAACPLTEKRRRESVATLRCAPSGLTFPVGQRLPQPRQLGPQLRHHNEAFLLLVHHPQGLQDLLFWRLLLELLVHDAQQGGKVQHTTATCGRDKQGQRRWRRVISERENEIRSSNRGAVKAEADKMVHAETPSTDDLCEVTR